MDGTPSTILEACASYDSITRIILFMVRMIPSCNTKHGISLIMLMVANLHDVDGVQE
jgi:hypothetical protein